MAISAHDVARELLERDPGIGKVKLQKLLYYAQAIHLSWYRQPLFSEAFEAWDLGPVVPEVYRYEQMAWTGVELRQPQPLTPRAITVIDATLVRFGKFTGKALSERTHDEPPWSDAYAQGQNTIIENEAIRKWFDSLPAERETLDMVAVIEGDPAVNAEFRVAREESLHREASPDDPDRIRRRLDELRPAI